MKQVKKQKEVIQDFSSQKEESTQGQSETIDDELPFTEIDELANHGINGGDINKLKGHGLCTILACLMCTKKEMCNIKGMSEAKVDKIMEAAGKMEKMCYKTGLQVLEQRKKIKRISTGSPALDQLL